MGDKGTCLRTRGMGYLRIPGGRTTECLMTSPLQVNQGVSRPCLLHPTHSPTKKTLSMATNHVRARVSQNQNPDAGTDGLAVAKRTGSFFVCWVGKWDEVPRVPTTDERSDQLDPRLARIQNRKLNRSGPRTQSLDPFPLSPLTPNAGRLAHRLPRTSCGLTRP